MVAAIELGTKLQRFAAAARLLGAGVQHWAAVAQARYALAVEQVGIYAGGLLGGVGAYAEHAARELVDELEGLQVKVFA